MLGHEYMALIGVVLGWLLNEAGRWVWARREEKKAIAQALAALLEIRHRVRSIPKAVELLSRRLNLPPDAETLLKVVLSQWFPADHGLLPRYADAVALVAAQNPILGFRLNQQDSVLPLLNQLRALVSRDPSAGLVWPKIETGLLATFSSHIDDLIRLLARRHGWVTRIRVGRLLGRKFEVPEGLLRILDGLPAFSARPPSLDTNERVTPGSGNPQATG